MADNITVACTYNELHSGWKTFAGACTIIHRNKDPTPLEITVVLIFPVLPLARTRQMSGFYLVIRVTDLATACATS